MFGTHVELHGGACSSDGEVHEKCASRSSQGGPGAQRRKRVVRTTHRFGRLPRHWRQSTKTAAATFLQYYVNLRVECASNTSPLAKYFQVMFHE